jgi:P-type Ca2+ transporter type 2C
MRHDAGVRRADRALADGRDDPAAPVPKAPDRTGIIVSIVPVHTAVAGRARLRVGGLRGAPGLATLIERGLTGFSGVGEVRASAVTGNVVIWYAAPTGLTPIIARIAALLRREVVPADDSTASPLAHWHTADSAEIAAGLGACTARGLPANEAGRRLIRAGANVLPSPQRRSDLSIFRDQFGGLPVALLTAAALLSAAIGGIVEAGAIMAVVALNGGIGFATERRAEHTIRSLEDNVAETARVLRDGCEQELAGEALVPGDVMILQRGMVVPADGRLVTACALAVSEAALTGESMPVAKSVAPLRRADVPLGDRVNMVYRGSIVTGGSGTAIVVATGGRTEIGRIRRLVETTAAPETPLQRQLDVLGRQLVWMTLAASGLIFGAGWMRGIALLQLARSALSVAVAAVPEGLPMVATATLAIGVEDMRRRGIFVRRLAAVETLAAVDVICFDKTGTLTHGSMSLDEIAVGDATVRRGNGGFMNQDNKPLQLAEDLRLRQLLCVVSLCSDTDIERRRGQNELVGTATENALVQAALDDGLDVAGLRARFARLSTRHRTETDRFMATTHRAGNGLLLAVKGSPPEVLARSTWELCSDGSRAVLTAQRRREICDLNAAMAARGLRVLAAASRDVRGRGVQGNAVDVERLVFIGLTGLVDPVRDGLPEMMAKLHACGIQTIMLTGDQSATARAVGQKVGLGDREPQVIDGAELDRLSAAELGLAARRTQAFARISPSQKLRVVRALQDSGAAVAMIGDGINDSPALRAANVGIAIGGDGSAVAREVADVFLATGDLTALPAAIARGRATYANVRRAIHYILSTNASEVAVMLAGTATGIGEVLTPMQLLWVNLVSDVLPAIGLTLEPPEADVMEQRPRRPGDSIVPRSHVGRLGTEAAVMAAGTFGGALYSALRRGPGAPQASTIAFGSLVTAQLLHALTYRSTKDGANSHQHSGNSLLPAIIGGSLAAQSAAMLLPGLRSLLGIAPLDVLDAVVMAAGGVVPFLVNAASRTSPAAATLHFRSPSGPRSGLQAPTPHLRQGEAPLTRLPPREAAAALAGSPAAVPGGDAEAAPTRQLEEQVR